MRKIERMKEKRQTDRQTETEKSKDPAHKTRVKQMGPIEKKNQTKRDKNR